MSYHIFGNINTYKLFSIMNSKGKSNHRWNYMTCSIPYFNYFFFSSIRHFTYLIQYFFIYIESFFKRSCHLFNRLKQIKFISKYIIKIINFLFF